MEKRGRLDKFQGLRALGVIWLIGAVTACGNANVPTLDETSKDPNALLSPLITTPTSFYISKTNSVVISGSCQEGATVTMSGSESNSVSCLNSSFSFSITKSTDGTYKFDLSQSDSQGHSSGTSSITWLLDTAVPSAPVLVSPAASPHFTNGNSVTLSGTCETGTTVQVTGPSATSSTKCISTVFSLTVSKTTDGTYAYSLAQTDSAGNVSAATNLTWIRDTQAPAAPTVTSPASSPFTSGDTNLTISGACEDGAQVSLSGSATATTTCSGASYSLTVSRSTDGTSNYSISQRDPAGNSSTATALTWIRDTSIPATPAITSPASNPAVTNTNSISLSGTCISGDTVTLGGDLVSSDVTSPAGSLTQSCSSGAYSFTVQKTSDATYNFTLNQTDPSSLSTSANASFQWTRDTVAPSAPVITTPATSPFKSNQSSLTLSGSCESGATVDLSGDDSQSVVCASSAFSFTINQSVDATYNFSVGQTDPAGNSSASASQQWQRSTVLPAAPTITTPAVASYLSNGSSLTISGACVSGDTVHLSGDDSGTFTCASSAYSFTVNKSIDGTYLFDVTQSDSFGNVSPAVSVSWTRDTLIPASPLITSPTANPYTSGDSSLTLSGTCESGATVNLSGAGTDSTTCSGGVFSFSITQASNGTYDYSLSQTDLATNVSSSTAFQWVLDNTIPGTPTITSPNQSPYNSNTGTITISGTCTSGNNINLGGNVLASEVTSPAGALVQACSGNAYSFTVQKTSDGSYTFLVNQENTTTGVLSADASLVWNRDTAVPAAPIVTNPATSPYTASGNLTISGTCETGTTVQLAGDSTASTTCAGGAFSFTVIESVDATYNFTLNQTDLAGNVSTNASLQWIRDSSVTPSPVITTPAASDYSSNLTSLTISGTCISGNTITLGGNIIASEVTNPAGSLTQTCTNSAFSYVVTKASDGTYSFNLMQTSVGQGDSALVPLNWTVDTTPPDTSITANPVDPNVSIDAIFSFSSGDPSSVFECQLDGGSYVACASPLTYASISQGSHTFNVRAKDSVGNRDPSPATFTWTQMSYKTIALYHFTSGNSLSDSSLFPSPYTNNLSDSTATTSTTGLFTDGQSFSSTASQYLSRVDNASLRALNTTMSFEAQVKFSSLPATGDYQVIASKTGISGNAGWEVRIKRQGSNFYLIFIGSTDGTAVSELKSTSCSLDTTSFHHIAITWNKGAVKFYLDGVAKGSGTIGVSGSSSLFASTADFRIGRSENMSATVGYFDGVMDELRLSQVLRWTSAFTAPSAEYSTVD